MQTARKAFTAAAFGLGLAQPMWAEGLTFRLEGGAAMNSGADVGVVSIVRDAPPTATSQLDFQPGMSRDPMSLSYRAEATWAFTLGNGAQVRIGGILSGQDGQKNEDLPVYGSVYTRPSGPDLPEAEIAVCSFSGPCRQFTGQLDRSYHEVMPELMFGLEGRGGATTWFGLQGFSGTMEERAQNSITPLSAPGATQTTVTEVAADTEGLMLAWQQERSLASGLTLLLGAGIGSYQTEAEGVSSVPGSPGRTRTVATSFDGLRGQLMVGLEKPLSDRLTMGLTARADHWTDQPRVKMDWVDAPCSPTLCEPPGRDGTFDLVTDPFTTVTFGLSLTLRL